MREQVVETKKIFESLLAKWNKWKFHGSDEDKLSKLEIHLFQHLLQVSEYLFLTDCILPHCLPFISHVCVSSVIDTSPP